MQPDSPFPCAEVSSLPKTASSLAKRLSLDGAAADAWLGGGLRADGLHELYAAQAEDGVSATGFALLIAQLQCRARHKPLIWVREARSIAQTGMPYGPGLLDLGLKPDAITLLMLPDARAVLRAGLDSVRDGALGAVLIELVGRQPLFDLTASRRFALAAAETGTIALFTRSKAEPIPSAAHTRWEVANAPSRSLEAGSPGFPAFALTLLRHRGGRDGLHLILEWDRDTASFRQRDERGDTAPLSCAQPAMAGGRTAGSGTARAA
ncbi:ImuA family protein [Rhizorhapis sp. SPR117]|uniref:ImuA family protein n=1 Tax=Rhizorhapis sp. SPR117 TaxID=2912611 RepID=UPI001F355257|nr:hypothetical protein [Rhizorhapis sp. SPR117]